MWCDGCERLPNCHWNGILNLCNYDGMSGSDGDGYGGRYCGRVIIVMKGMEVVMMMMAMTADIGDG